MTLRTSAALNRRLNTAAASTQRCANVLHPEWAPIDIDLGGFTLQPQISVSSLFTDNEKFSTTDASARTSRFASSPLSHSSSNWNRNGFGLQAFVAQTEYVHGPAKTIPPSMGPPPPAIWTFSEDLSVDLRGSDQHLVLSRSDPDVPT